MKQLQHKTRCMVALSHFISKLGEQGLPFLKLLHVSKPFKWINKVEQALQSLKEYITSPLVMVDIEEVKPLFLYINATPNIVHMVLIIER